MHDVDERRRVTAEVFAATGKKCAEDDPVIIAALFQAHTIRAAGEEAAHAIKAAADDARKAAAAAEAIARTAADDRQKFAQAASAAQKALADTIELRVKKAVRDASRVQSTHQGPPQGWHGVLAGIAFGIAATAGAVGVACNFDFSWTKDAALGRMLKAVYPTLSANSKEELSRQAEKLYPR